MEEHLKSHKNIDLSNIKKLNYFLIIVIVFISLFSCTSKQTLLFLNWGEYINDELVEKFEKEYNCNVIIDIAESNELFYAKVKSGTTIYDLTCPSDYMIEKLYSKGLIEEIDYSKIPNYSKDLFLNPLISLQIDMENSYPGVNNYHIPYFWGTFGIMYNKQNENTEKLVKEYGMRALFDDLVMPKSLKVGMYNVPRFSFAAAMIYEQLDPNDGSMENLMTFETVLSKRKFNEWGTDTLKKGIESGNLDIAFAYTGDCLDMIYVKIEDGVALSDMNFDIYVPSNTILHMDSLVIPKGARHKELAYKFLNFMLEPKNAYENASVVGYCTPLKSSYQMILDNLKLESNEDNFWNIEWAKTVSKYYPTDSEGIMHVTGTPLSYFDSKELTELTNIINKIKSNN